MPYQSTAETAGSGNDVCVYTVYSNAGNLIPCINDKVGFSWALNTEFLHRYEECERLQVNLISRCSKVQG